MIVAVTGAGGLIGSALVSSLRASGHRVIPLVRRPPRAGEDALRWEPESGAIAPAAPGLDAVVHLAGESIMGLRWTAAKKRRIRDSRMTATRLLVQTLVRLPKPPGVLISASAIGYYGSRGDEVLTEDSRPGTGFLAEVARDWEAASAAAIARGIRVVNPRFGVVLSARGGALAKHAKREQPQARAAPTPHGRSSRGRVKEPGIELLPSWQRPGWPPPPEP